MTPLDCTVQIDGPIQIVGSSFYFDPETVAHGKAAVGLDGFRFYILGRGGVLGDVDGALVHSAFGYFEPGLVDKMWSSAVERTTANGPRSVADEYLGCSHRFAVARFEALDLDAFVAAARSVVDAADPAALALFAGYRRMDVPSGSSEAAMHYAILLRELRGAVHLAAIAALGIHSKVAHQIRRPNDVETFGWADDTTEPSSDHREQLVEVDRLTNEAMARHLEVLDDGERQALVDGATAMAAAL